MPCEYQSWTQFQVSSFMHFAHFMLPKKQHQHFQFVRSGQGQSPYNLRWPTTLNDNIDTTRPHAIHKAWVRPASPWKASIDAIVGAALLVAAVKGTSPSDPTLKFYGQCTAIPAAKLAGPRTAKTVCAVWAGRPSRLRTRARWTTWTISPGRDSQVGGVCPSTVCHMVS